MKKLSQRVASLTPPITVGLILFTVALTAFLAYRAFDASRAQRRMTENTLREYAGFAAFQLKNATILRVGGQHRGAFEQVVRAISTRGATPPLGVEQAAALVRSRGAQCRCLGGVSFYYQVSFADSRIEATASGLATPENLRRIRDTVIAQALDPARPDPPLPNLSGRRVGAPVTSQSLVTTFSNLGERPYLFIHALTADATGAPVVAYGFAVPAEQPVGRAVKMALASQPVLPSTLTRGMSVDSILAITVRSPTGKLVYESNAGVSRRYAATDSLEPRNGGLRFEVAIDPAAAGRLIIGGLPRSRLPEVLATAFVAVALLGLLLYQFRRQEELGRLRDDFVSGVSHELRTPLAQIRLLAELLYMGKVPSEERERSLRIIDKEARRLSFLVDSILNFTHTQRSEMSPVRTEVATEIEEIVSGFEPLAQAQGVHLTTRLEKGIVADVDRGALRQVLLNLLDNAVRYGPSGQSVTITTQSAENNWTLEVADEGPGIPADESDRIFAPYYRMKRDAGGAVGGTGIGLAVVRRVVKEHNGRVHVASANGNGEVGARFVVTLPIDVQGVNGK
ncbi:MAG TPA: HAMP domain-containing sensor histidine kinase [Gemmatimonadaceae bacterium]|nr:HAMP domain-containing sensor histidine kinase [Gemmatimonadaceae bacterium]